MAGCCKFGGALFVLRTNSVSDANVRMEFIYVLRTLWHRKWWVLAAFVLAVVAAIYVRHEMTPGGRFGVASQEVLLDAPSSALGDLHREIDPLAQRGGVFAQVLTSEPLVDEIGRNAGIPGAEIAVTGPPLIIDGLPAQSTKPRGQRSVKADYAIRVLRGDNLPLLSISSQAPTPGEARRLVDGTTRALAKLVDRVQQQSEIPENRRLTIRVFGSVQAGQVIDPPAKLPVLAAFLFVFGLGCIVILVVPAIVAGLRTTNSPHGLAADLFRPPAPAGMTDNGSGDLTARAEWAESLGADLDRAPLGSDSPSHVVALDPERWPVGESADRVLRDQRDG